MWSAASTTALWVQWSNDIGTMLYVIIGAILTVVAGLILIGFAVRKTQKKVTGKKF